MKLSILSILLLALAGSLHAAPLREDEQQQARRLFVALGCQACHDFENSGADFAPSLDRIGLKLNEGQILQRLQRPSTELKDDAKFMPSYQTTPTDQLKLLSRFLAGRK